MSQVVCIRGTQIALNQTIGRNEWLVDSSMQEGLDYERIYMYTYCVDFFNPYCCIQIGN